MRRICGEVSVKALSDGFKSTAPEQATLTIHILHQVVFDRFRSEQEPSANRQKAGKPHRPVRAFISYSGTSEHHKNWVADIGTYLRANGINARLDQWHLRPGMDIPQWMTNELELAERVVIISDARYADRADGRSGGDGWETMLIQGDMSNLPPDSTKYLTILRENNFDSGVPRYLKTKYCMHWNSELDQERLKTDLLQELFDIPKEPPIGLPPSLEI